MEVCDEQPERRRHQTHAEESNGLMEWLGFGNISIALMLTILGLASRPGFPIPGGAVAELLTTYEILNMMAARSLSKLLPKMPFMRPRELDP
jgi:hypothetical protein